MEQIKRTPVSFEGYTPLRNHLLLEVSTTMKVFELQSIGSVLKANANAPSGKVKDEDWRYKVIAYGGGTTDDLKVNDCVEYNLGLGGQQVIIKSKKNSSFVALCDMYYDLAGSDKDTYNAMVKSKVTATSKDYYLVPEYDIKCIIVHDEIVESKEEKPVLSIAP